MDNHIYGITTTEWRKFLEDCLEITPATALTFQADLHKCTQHAIDKMWKARNTAKHGMALLLSYGNSERLKRLLNLGMQMQKGRVRFLLKGQKLEYEPGLGNGS